MNNERLNNELQSLERKLSMLLKEHAMLKEELLFLKRENTELKQVIKQKDESLNSFQNQFKINKLVNTIGTGGKDTSELKEKIDDYIKEIDNCIVQLTR